MIKPININFNDQYEWFPRIECDTYSEPSFMYMGKIYIKYNVINPNIINQDSLENIMKMSDSNVDMDDDTTMFIELFNMEKVYAYMLKQLLSKL